MENLRLVNIISLIVIIIITEKIFSSIEVFGIIRIGVCMFFDDRIFFKGNAENLEKQRQIGKNCLEHKGSTSRFPKINSKSTSLT